jgi:hypothetical protein
MDYLTQLKNLRKRQVYTSELEKKNLKPPGLILTKLTKILIATLNNRRI